MNCLCFGNNIQGLWCYKLWYTWKNYSIMCSTGAKSVTALQITHRNYGLWFAERHFLSQWHRVKRWQKICTETLKNVAKNVFKKDCPAFPPLEGARTISAFLKNALAQINYKLNVIVKCIRMKSISQTTGNSIQFRKQTFITITIINTNDSGNRHERSFYAPVAIVNWHIF